MNRLICCVMAALLLAPIGLAHADAPIVPPPTQAPVDPIDQANQQADQAAANAQAAAQQAANSAAAAQAAIANAQAAQLSAANALAQAQAARRAADDRALQQARDTSADAANLAAQADRAAAAAIQAARTSLIAAHAAQISAQSASVAYTNAQRAQRTAADIQGALASADRAALIDTRTSLTAARLSGSETARQLDDYRLIIALLGSLCIFQVIVSVLQRRTPPAVQIIEERTIVSGTALGQRMPDHGPIIIDPAAIIAADRLWEQTA